jgi:hypothetical protein
MPCVVVFGQSGEGTHSVSLDLDADEVGKRLKSADGFEQFETAKGGSVWINSRNVLYVTERKRGSAKVLSFS